MMELVAGDIGGTHARFALAEVANGRVVRLDEPVTLATGEQAGLAEAWWALGAAMGRPLPRAAALAAASASGAAAGGLTDDIWTMSPAAVDAALGLDTHLFLNDFGAIAHAVQHGGSEQFAHLCGPDRPLPDTGVITICGPGTGIGCAELVRRAAGYEVIETEGGHIGFAPVDPFEDALAADLRQAFGRVSVERVGAGPSIVPIHARVMAERGLAGAATSERDLWRTGLDGSDPRAVEAVERFCRILGGAAGDLALAHGAVAVVIAGGLGLRLRAVLAGSGFAERFAAKGRFRARMEGLPVKLITHPQPGLFGAAAAFAARFR